MSTRLKMAARNFAAGVAEERERLRELVEAVRAANAEAQQPGEVILLTPLQERAWLALMAGLAPEADDHA